MALPQKSEYLLGRGGVKVAPTARSKSFNHQGFLVFQRAASKKLEAATVTETDLHSRTERQGKLNPYYFNNLLRLIEEQGYFCMSNQYAMGWVDSAMVKVGVRIGERRKTIVTRNEGDVPIELWGIYYAIEGARANVDWRTSPVIPQSNKRLQRTRR